MSLARNCQTNGDIYFLGKYCWLSGLTSSVRMPSSRAFAIRQVQASEQLSHRLFLPAKQHGQSLTAIMSNRHTTDREQIADRDLAIFQRDITWPLFYISPKAWLQAPRT